MEARSTRRIDDVRISASLPEEYGFLLPDRRLSATSAPKVAAIHRELAAGRETARVLLKNPWDLPRAGRVAALFPGACFVFVVRDPVRTLDSQLRAARTLLAGPSEYEALLNPRFRRLVRRRRLLALLRRLYSRGWVVDRLLRAFARGTTRWIRDLDSLPDGRWTVTRYEDLVARPLEEITRLYGFLDLPPIEIPRLAGQIRPRDRPLDPHVAARVPKILERTRLFRETFGYGSESNPQGASR